VLDAFRRIVQALRESSRAAEKDVGLSGARLFILRTVAESPGLSLSELAKRTRTHQSSVSVVVAHLVSEGLVARRTAAGDSRRAALWLTATGRGRLEKSPETAQERLLDGVDALPAAERARLARTLNLLVQDVAGSHRQPTMFFEDSSAASGNHPTTRRRKAPVRR
jgi:DNA-binding MarR family transcriptional regulator